MLFVSLFYLCCSPLSGITLLSSVSSRSRYYLVLVSIWTWGSSKSCLHQNKYKCYFTNLTSVLQTFLLASLLLRSYTFNTQSAQYSEPADSIIDNNEESNTMSDINHVRVIGISGICMNISFQVLDQYFLALSPEQCQPKSTYKILMPTTHCRKITSVPQQVRSRHQLC